MCEFIFAAYCYKNNVYEAIEYNHRIRQISPYLHMGTAQGPLPDAVPPEVGTVHREFLELTLEQRPHLDAAFICMLENYQV